MKVSDVKAPVTGAETDTVAVAVAVVPLLSVAVTLADYVPLVA